MYEFLFFKQKTAYEMRISDWSSDVCSSDLETFNLADAVGRAGIVGLRDHQRDQHFRVAADEMLQFGRVQLGALASPIVRGAVRHVLLDELQEVLVERLEYGFPEDRKSTRLNSSH